MRSLGQNPSESELQGIVLLEGAASGLPLIGADALAIPEIITHGENGFLHRPGDADDLAARTVCLARDPALRARLGAAGIRRAQAHALPACVAQMEMVYEAALAGSAKKS